MVSSSCALLSTSNPGRHVALSSCAQVHVLLEVVLLLVKRQVHVFSKFVLLLVGLFDEREWHTC